MPNFSVIASLVFKLIFLHIEESTNSGIICIIYSTGSFVRILPYYTISDRNLCKYQPKQNWKIIDFQFLRSNWGLFLRYFSSLLWACSFKCVHKLAIITRWTRKLWPSVTFRYVTATRTAHIDEWVYFGHLILSTQITLKRSRITTSQLSSICSKVNYPFFKIFKITFKSNDVKHAYRIATNNCKMLSGIFAEDDPIHEKGKWRTNEKTVSQIWI